MRSPASLGPPARPYGGGAGSASGWTSGQLDGGRTSRFRPASATVRHSLDEVLGVETPIHRLAFEDPVADVLHVVA